MFHPMKVFSGTNTMTFKSIACSNIMLESRWIELFQSSSDDGRSVVWSFRGLVVLSFGGVAVVVDVSNSLYLL